MLLLEEEERRRYTGIISIRRRQRILRQCVGTFLKNDPRNVDVYVNKSGLSGEVTVRVLLENSIYETGVGFGWNRDEGSWGRVFGKEMNKRDIIEVAGILF